MKGECSECDLHPEASVTTKGGVAVVPATGEVRYQLSIADHEKQATTWSKKQEETRFNVNH